MRYTVRSNGVLPRALPIQGIKALTCISVERDISVQRRVIKRLTERRAKHVLAGWNQNQLEPKLGVNSL